MYSTCLYYVVKNILQYRMRTSLCPSMFTEYLDCYAWHSGHVTNYYQNVVALACGSVALCSTRAEIVEFISASTNVQYVPIFTS